MLGKKTVDQVLRMAGAQLKKVSSTPALDGELLLSLVIQKPREFLFSHPEHQLSPAQLNRFSLLLKRRAHREPVAYLLGHKEFFGLDFLVTPAVLIPRPETELVVETVIKLVGKKNHYLMVDVGTGSGAIAIALKKSLPNIKMSATDISQKALQVARKNAKRLGMNVTFKSGSLLSPIKHQKFDCIVSNPPYLTKAELKNPDLAFEPVNALFGGRSGLDLYRALLKQAEIVLAPHGCLILEIGATQSKTISTLSKKYWPTATVTITKDYAGFDRVLTIQT